MVKRVFDLGFAAAALVVLSPVILVAALLVRVRLGAPVFFRQPRAGLHGTTFTLWKFRTMSNAVDGTGRLKSDAERLTPFGAMLRSTSLDELPELWNVLRGDMCLVGPRPLLVEYLSRYTAVEARRHEVRPGITGWAQVHGRNATTWDERLRLDVWYVDHRSFGIDLLVLWRTLAVVMRRDGIQAPGEATMQEFRPPVATGIPAGPPVPGSGASSSFR